MHGRGRYCVTGAASRGTDIAQGMTTGRSLRWDFAVGRPTRPFVSPGGRRSLHVRTTLPLASSMSTSAFSVVLQAQHAKFRLSRRR